MYVGGNKVKVKSWDYGLKSCTLLLHLLTQVVLYERDNLFCSYYCSCAQSCFSVLNRSLLSSLRTMWARRPSTRLLVRAVWSVSTLSWFRERKLSKSCDQICVFISFPLYYPTSQLHLYKGSSPNSEARSSYFLNMLSTFQIIRV